MTGRTYLFNYEQQRDSGTPNTLEEGVRSPAGQPDAAAGGGAAVRVCIDLEWHCGYDKKGTSRPKAEGACVKSILAMRQCLLPSLSVGILA